MLEYYGFCNINIYACHADTKEAGEEKIGQEILRILNSEDYKHDTYRSIRDDDNHVKPNSNETAFQCIERLYNEDIEYSCHAASTMTFQDNFKYKIAEEEVRM